MGCRVCFSPLHQKFLENRRESAVLVSAGTVEMGNIDGIDGSGGLQPTACILESPYHSATRAHPRHTTVA
ncbi:hypothetical protein DRA67_03780 [Neisseria meningitidis]|uniref:Uncharacterized protein n=1 Tax=Neisseria meningitidis TaxID=487 RepID=A0AB36RUG2_NEIME|nr:hypothetical protein NMBG2136_0956 [Neisseria meningitidis G2136]ARB71945.1 hypothetical protein A6J54_09945 [Neisseria meningitidis]EGC54829.1 hypothetical protein NMBM6190_1171 [Neisseria meningitidis M6190]ARC10972.1 hypothetical protein A6J50_12525 [Neisseria meningitidis]ARC13040.1 hypothetical protein A6J51_11235 [Neisseria meningitidis]